MDRNRQILEAIKNTAANVLPEGSRIRLFGSRARGDNREDSDWDIHILIPGEKKLYFYETTEYAYPFEKLGFENDEVFSILIYTFKEWETRSYLPFYKNVEAEGIDL